MKIDAFLLLHFCIVSTSAAQDTAITLSGSFKPQDKSPAYVAVVGNTDQNSLMGEAKVAQGNFELQLPADLPHGVYKLAFGTKDKMLFYFTHEGEKAYHMDFSNTNNDWQFSSNTGKTNQYTSNYWQKADSLMIAIGSLYGFLQTYPHKNESSYKTASKTLDTKIDEFKTQETIAIANAPPYAREILSQNKVTFYNPSWDKNRIKSNFFDHLWGSIPRNDSTYYNKPYFLDKLIISFQDITEDIRITEAEKYQTIQTQLKWLLDKLKTYPHHEQYYNLCLRYFANANYPYVLHLIDDYINEDIDWLLEQDSIGYIYRAAQNNLIKQKAPQIPTENGADILTTSTRAKTLLVFVAGNTKFSSQLLRQLQQDVSAMPETNIMAILLTEDKQSIQNFKGLYPHWTVATPKVEAAKKVIEAYKLVYVPTVYVLDQDRIIQRILKPFERVSP